MDLERALRTGRTVRTIGWDDRPFLRQPGGTVPLYGVVCAGTRLEGFVRATVRQDGWNAGPRIAQALGDGKFLAQVHAVLLDGIAVAGLNVVDLPWLATVLGRPCLAVMRKLPDLQAMRRVIERLPRADERLRRLQVAGPIHSAGPMQFQVAGCAPQVAAELLVRITDRGHVPEPLRLAHLLAGAMAGQQSGRRA